MRGISSWLTGKTGTPAPTSHNNTEHPSASRTSTDTFTTGDSAPAAAPTPSSSHSLDSPSPSPQPATPDDSTAVGGRPNYFGHGAPATSKPIDIASPNIRSSQSQSPNPGNDVDYQSRGTQKNAPGISALDDSADFLRRETDTDVDMTTGPGLEAAFGRTRQDSFVSAGPKPISMNPNRDQARNGRRESLAGSFMNGGMSWGGLSVGSFIRDE